MIGKALNRADTGQCHLHGLFLPWKPQKPQETSVQGCDTVDHLSARIQIEWCGAKQLLRTRKNRNHELCTPHRRGIWQRSGRGIQWQHGFLQNQMPVGGAVQGTAWRVRPSKQSNPEFMGLELLFPIHFWALLVPSEGGIEWKLCEGNLTVFSQVLWSQLVVVLNSWYHMALYILFITSLSIARILSMSPEHLRGHMLLFLSDSAQKLSNKFHHIIPFSH